VEPGWTTRHSHAEWQRASLECRRRKRRDGGSDRRRRQVGVQSRRSVCCDGWLGSHSARVALSRHDRGHSVDASDWCPGGRVQRRRSLPHGVDRRHPRVPPSSSAVAVIAGSAGRRSVRAPCAQSHSRGVAPALASRALPQNLSEPAHARKRAGPDLRPRQSRRGCGRGQGNTAAVRCAGASGGQHGRHECGESNMLGRKSGRRAP